MVISKYQRPASDHSIPYLTNILYTTMLLILKRFLNLIMMPWYCYVNKRVKEGDLHFLNYGYTDDSLNIALNEEDENERLPIQLYHYVAAPVGLDGMDVLEVGCGRGGGASYIDRYFDPKSITGVDLSKQAIDFCRRHYASPRLRFEVMDALDLTFDEKSFDVVINIESSHRYANMGKFVEEVYRILKPNGFFLFADFRFSHLVGYLDSMLRKPEFYDVRTEYITEGVIKALEADEERRINLIKKFTPKFLHIAAKEFAGTRGTRLYRSFVERKREYIYTVLKK